MFPFFKIFSSVDGVFSSSKKQFLKFSMSKSWIEFRIYVGLKIYCVVRIHFKSVLPLKGGVGVFLF